MTGLMNDLDLYSDLLLSVGTGTFERPLTPIECSDYIMQLKEETGQSWEQLSVKLGLGKKVKITTMDAPPDTTQIRFFAKLQKLSRKNAYALGFGTSGDGAVGFTIGCVVADLPNKKDHDTILTTVLDSQETDNPLILKDVKQIVERKKKSPNQPIEEIIEHVKKIKPRTETSYVMLVRPESILLDTINQKLKEENIESKKFLKEIIDAELVNNEISLIKLRKNMIMIIIDENNFKKVEGIWKSQKTNFTNYFNSILKRGLKIE